MRIARRHRWFAMVAAALVLAACTQASGGSGTPAPTSPHTSTASATGAPSGSPFGTRAACPPSYRMADPSRPRVDLTFTVAADHGTVTGTEHLTFLPDLPIKELVFRLTANSPYTAAAGTHITVTSATTDRGNAPPTFTSAGAAPDTQGGLVRIPLPSSAAAGTTVTADLRFMLTLGGGQFDRFGRSGKFAWFGSAQPLLAWERGFGWHTEPMVPFAAETATSEAMQTSLTVIAPGADRVIMSGDPRSAEIAGQDRIWRSSIAAARDVSVAVGPFSVRDASVGGVSLRVAAPSSATGGQLLPQFERALTQLSRRFGPYPFPSLSVARVPMGGGGIEYPSSILMLADSEVVAVHETAHQWFYAMVGDSQALHPWLDEAFASYAEQLIDNDPPPPATLSEPGEVDRPIAQYGSDVDGYFEVTYSKGAAVLHAARAAAGASAFDAAIRCYVNKNAWRIANPSDLAAALSGLPAALTVLRRAQALR